MTITTLQHDGFARTALVRESGEVPHGTECGWCNQAARFRYGIERDDRPGRIDWASGYWCSVGCFRNAS